MMEQQAFFLQYLPQNVDPKDTARVYFATHPADHEKTFHRFAQELIDAARNLGAKVTVWHRNGGELLPQAAEQVQDQLSSMQLLVVPVTQALFAEPERCMAVEVAYAKAHNIPILPILLQKELIAQYSLPENFGELQFLDPEETDATALPYQQKLTEFLRTYLVTDEQRQRVREAFSGYIFLSYRKKDRREAQALMKRIHANGCCQDIAIWYDEFLTPGENFTKAIQDALHKSCLFALVLTPNITEPGNYVMTHEYPMAQQLQKDILPLECIQADADALNRSFEALPGITDSNDPEQLEAALQTHLAQIVRKEPTPDHDFLMGLAYLHGIDVEMDGQKAEALLKKAAEAKHLEATITLANMYRNGQGVPMDLKRTVWFFEDACGLLVPLCREDPQRYRVPLIQNLLETSTAYFRIGDYGSAERFAREVKLYARLGYRDTGDLQYLNQFIMGELSVMGAWCSKTLRQCPEKNQVEIFREGLEQCQATERYLEECGLTQEQLREISGSLNMFYSMLQSWSMQSGDLERSREYAEKLRLAGCITDEVLHISERFVALAQNDDTASVSEMISHFAEMIDEASGVMDKMTAGEKIKRLCNMLPGFLQAISGLSRYLVDMKPEGAPDQQEMLLVRDQIQKLIHRIEDIFEPLNIETVPESYLDMLGNFYSLLSVSYYSLEEEETALALNRKHLSVAKLSFEHYPTDEALHSMINANMLMDGIVFELADRKKRWQELEAAYKLTYRKTLENAAGLDHLMNIYRTLANCALNEGNLEEAESYVKGLTEAAHRKWRMTNRLADEWEYLHGEYQYCCIQQENKRYQIDSRIRRAMRRCKELMDNPNNISFRALQDVTLQYRRWECLLAQVLARYGKKTEAMMYIRDILSMPHEQLFTPKLMNDVMKIFQLQQELEE